MHRIYENFEEDATEKDFEHVGSCGSCRWALLVQHGGPSHREKSSKEVDRYAYIRTMKSQLKEITADNFVKFVSSQVDSADYDYLSIVCDDGTGLYFAGYRTTIAAFMAIFTANPTTKRLLEAMEIYNQDFRCFIDL